ncbi:5'-nucleotidase C-terminal domain-containing protein [Exiguobacterium sp. TBG-PICH-001]|uniref:5'-nucleotidase C-terminal domain-containing protein n=1 Tax=Exiguobacterium abrahamii TaxID=2785532 RepID=UPI0018A786BE|nr:5'-nucleotidase C-terminal domain-containing protein [Exiguobacterium sp. TBG-PICH-001]MBF8151844.1 5'-nucleotidase C-terminal domain-containing protein [Exiguobacterium sp. TBG-PICH-001]
MYKSKPLYAAAVAVALTTSAIVPVAQTTVSAATHVKVKTVKLKSLVFTKGASVKLPATYKGEKITWKSYDRHAFNRYQTVKGTYGKKKNPIEIKIYIQNYAVKFVEKVADQTIYVDQKPELPKTLAVLYATGRIYDKPVRWSKVDTSEAGVKYAVASYTRLGKTITLKAKITVLDVNTDDFSIGLMHTNDTHANLDKAPKRATVIKELRSAYRAEGKPSLLLDAGDVFSGSLYFNKFLGQADLELMNYMKYDMMTFGNHEFDLGDTDNNIALKNFVTKAKFPFITANVDFSKNELFNGLQKKTITAGPERGKIYQGIIKEYKGQKIGFFGLTTEETADIASPGTVAFANYITSAKAAVKKLEDRGVNKIVALTHIGFDDNEAIDNDQLLARNVDGIDVIVGGHSHTKLEKPVVVDETVVPGKSEPTIIAQAYQYGDFLGNLDLTFDYKGKLTEYNGSLIDVSKAAEDVRAAEILKPYADQIAELKNEEVGANIVNALPNPRGEVSVRNSETALGNLITDGMLKKAKEYNKDTVIAMQNGGGIRAAIDAGPLTVGEVLTTLPFGNTLATAKMTGEEIKALLEISVGVAPVENGGFLHVSGMKFEYDSTKAKGERVTKMEVNNNGTFEVIDPAKTYVIATNAFTAKGGDGLTPFETAYKAGRVTDLGLSDWENLRDFTKSLGQVDYKIEGRIVDTSKLPN